MATESQLTVILGKLVTLLDAVSGVQRVYAYEPFVTAPAQYTSTMGGSQAVDYWTVRPATSEPARQVGYQMEFHHIVAFRHYLSVGAVDQTTPTVDQVALAVLNRFSTVFAITPEAEMTGPLRAVEWAEFFMLGGGELVYRSVFHLPVQELVVTQ